MIDFRSTYSSCVNVCVICHNSLYHQKMWFRSKYSMSCQINLYRKFFDNESETNPFMANPLFKWILIYHCNLIWNKYFMFNIFHPLKFMMLFMILLSILSSQSKEKKINLDPCSSSSIFISVWKVLISTRSNFTLPYLIYFQGHYYSEGRGVIRWYCDS